MPRLFLPHSFFLNIYKQTNKQKETNLHVISRLVSTPLLLQASSIVDDSTLLPLSFSSAVPASDKLSVSSLSSSPLRKACSISDSEAYERDGSILSTVSYAVRLY